MSRLGLLFVVLLLPFAAHAQLSTGFTAANALGCKVWVPLQLHAPDYVPHYTGGCVKGFAQGKGELRWMYGNLESARNKTTWAGFFQDGVYVGAARSRTRSSRSHNRTTISSTLVQPEVRMFS